MDLWSQLSPEWQKALSEVQDLVESIGEKLEKVPSINPDPKFIFRALGASPRDFRVILLGQDPYPNAQYAMGLACSVPISVKKLPPSLKNIQAEYLADLGKAAPQDLTPWSKGGVLLLNRILTCETGKTLSHKDFGWQKVTEEIVKSVLEVNPDAIGLLWGNKAQELADLFKSDCVVVSVHPSPLSAYPRDGKPGFFGSKPFSKVNAALKETGQNPIDW